MKIALLNGCRVNGCFELGEGTYEQLNTPHYSTNVSLLPIPPTVQDWRAQHRTARKRAAHATRRGYWFDSIDRSQHADAIHEINTSAPERQGRPMSAGYLERQTFERLPDYPCDHHAIRTYGVIDADGTLVAYTVIHRVGELALVSQILGHADHLEREIMYLLMQGVVAAQARLGGVLYYNRHDGGTPGLVFYKERVGFAAGNVEWAL